MRKYPAILFFLLLFISGSSYAAMPIGPTPSSPASTPNTLRSPIIEKFVGKRPGWLQRIELKLLQKKLRKHKFSGVLTSKQEDQATTSMILGIASLLLLVIPVGIISLLCFPAALLAIIFGIQSLKGNSNAKGIVGVITGGLTLLIFLVVLGLVLFAFNGFRFE